MNGMSYEVPNIIYSLFLWSYSAGAFLSNMMWQLKYAAICDFRKKEM